MAVIRFPAEFKEIGPPLVCDRYLTFLVGQESYAIHQSRVQEIVRRRLLAAAPWMPDCLHGVVLLRHTVLPVVDLRRKFGLHHIANTPDTCMIVIQLYAATHRIHQVGLIVDRVHETVQLAPHEIEETPEFKASADTAFVCGLAHTRGTLQTLLDVDWLLARERCACVAHG